MACHLGVFLDDLLTKLNMVHPELHFAYAQVDYRKYKFMICTKGKQYHFNTLMVETNHAAEIQSITFSDHPDLTSHEVPGHIVHETDQAFFDAVYYYLLGSIVISGVKFLTVFLDREEKAREAK